MKTTQFALSPFVAVANSKDLSKHDRANVLALALGDFFGVPTSAVNTDTGEWAVVLEAVNIIEAKNMRAILMDLEWSEDAPRVFAATDIRDEETLLDITKD